MRPARSIEPSADLNLRASIEKGAVPGPTMDVTGPYIEGPGLGIPQIKEIRGPDDARKMVSYWAGEGVNSFKVYNRLTKKELKATLEEAHQLNKKVTGHLCSITFREAADLGIDNLEHGFLTSTDFVKDKKENKCPGNRAVMGSLLEVSDKQINELIHYLVQKNIAITSTLTVFETFTPGRPRISDAELDAMLPTTREYYLKRWSRIATSTDSSWRILFKKEMAWEKAFSDAGGLLMAGTDPTGYGGIIPGYSNLRAIELLVEGGFSLEEAIKVGTLNGAIYLNMQNEIGTVELGKEADLIIIDGDPTQDLSQLRKVEMVFKHGVGYNPQKLIEAAKGRVGLH